MRRGRSSVLAMELPQSLAEPSIYKLGFRDSVFIIFLPVLEKKNYDCFFWRKTVLIEIDIWLLY